MENNTNNTSYVFSTTGPSDSLKNTDFITDKTNHDISSLEISYLFVGGIVLILSFTIVVIFVLKIIHMRRRLRHLKIRGVKEKCSCCKEGPMNEADVRSISVQSCDSGCHMTSNCETIDENDYDLLSESSVSLLNKNCLSNADIPYTRTVSLNNKKECEGSFHRQSTARGTCHAWARGCRHAESLLPGKQLRCLPNSRQKVEAFSKTNTSKPSLNSKPREKGSLEGGMLRKTLNFSIPAEYINCYNPNIQVNPKSNTKCQTENNSDPILSSQLKPAEEDKTGDNLILERNITSMHRNMSSNDLGKKCVIVKPLASPDPENFKREVSAQNNTKGVDIQKLNWNQIFLFLVRRIKVTEWQLFANILLGGSCSRLPEHETVDDRIEQIRANNRNITDCILMCLKYWKQIMASEASPSHIEEAMKHLGWNDVVHDFAEYMKDPPMMPVKQILAKGSAADKYGFVTQCSGSTVYMYPGAPRNNFYPFPSTSTSGSADRPSSGPIIEEINLEETCLLPESNEETHNSSGILGVLRSRPPNAGSIKTVKKKRKLPMHVLSQHRKRKSGSLNTCKQMHVVQGLRRRRTKKVFRNSRTNLKQKCKSLRLENCIISLIEDPPTRFKSLSKIAYNTYMKNTIECILMKTHASKQTVLSLKLADYRDIDMFKTKRKEEVYILYSGEQKLTLDKKDYEKMKLYVESARTNRIKDLKDSEGDNFVEPEALFLNYRGKPATIENVFQLIDRHCCSTTLSNSSSAGESESNISLNTTSHFKEDSQGQAFINFDESFDSLTDSEVLQSRTKLGSLNTEEDQNKVSVDNDITMFQDSTDCNGFVTMCNSTNNVRPSMTNERQDTAEDVAEIKLSDNYIDEIRFNDEILIVCMFYVIEEIRKMAKTQHLKLEDVELD